MKKRKNFLILFVSALVFANFGLGYEVLKTELAPPLSVTFFDVGQGDAAFLETKSGTQILIDGGPSDEVVKKLAHAMPFYDRTIDLVILTHPELDHIFGLLEVVKRYKIKNILWTGAKKESPQYKEWVRLIEKEGANIIIAKSGLNSLIQNNPQISLEILSPGKDISGSAPDDMNESSVVMRLDFGKTCILFMGDAGKKTEKERNWDSCDVLKLGHHGSETATSDEFLAKVQPKVAVISAGRKNQYGLPAKSVLEKLGKSGIEIKRTDEEGDIKIVME